MYESEFSSCFDAIHSQLSSKHKREIKEALDVHGEAFHIAWRNLLHCIKQCSEYSSLLNMTSCSSEYNPNNFLDVYFLISNPRYKVCNKKYVDFPISTTKDWDFFTHFLELNLLIYFSKVKINIVEKYPECFPNTFSMHIIAYL